MKVIYLNRAKGRFWSIEELFATIASALPSTVVSETCTVPKPGASLPALLCNMWWSASLKNADLVHVTGDIHYALIGMWRVPTVLTIHDLRFIENEAGLRRFLFWLLWLYLPCKRAERVTVISQFTKRRLEEFVRIPKHKLHVIPDCVDPIFKARPKPTLSDPPIILQVGTTSNKNLERLILACQGLNLELRVLGRLSDQQKILLAQNGVRAREYVDLDRSEVVRLYEDSDVVTFVSTYEGFGLPILEAQAVGRPVLTSNLPPMDEVAGAGALCVDPQDVNAIRHGIARLLQEAELRNSLIHKGLENVRRYTPESVARQFYQLYSNMTFDKHARLL